MCAVSMASRVDRQRSSWLTCLACTGRQDRMDSKGIVYALIGGLCCRAAADGNANVDASPQVCAVPAHTIMTCRQAMLGVASMYAKSLCILYYLVLCKTYVKRAALTSVQGAFELLGSGRSGKIILLMEMAGVRPTFHVPSTYCIG